MNITFVTEYFWPEIGGLERSTERLAQFLAGIGHNVTVLTTSLPGIPHAEERSGVSIFREDHTTRVAFTETKMASELLARSNFICLFGVGHDNQARHWIPILEHKTAVRALKIGTHGDIERSGIPKEFFTSLDGIYCQNSAIIDECISAGVEPSRCVLVTNGINVAGWQGALPSQSVAREFFDFPLDEYIILALGRIVKRKRFPLIIEAFERYWREYSRGILIIHGSDFGQSDGEESYLREIVHRIPEVPIRFVSPDFGAEYTLSASDILVALGEREGAPNIIIEAMAANCVTVASDIPGHKVYIRNGINGLIINEPLKDSLPLAFDTLSDISYRQSLKDVASNDVYKFDISIVAANYMRGFDIFVALLHHDRDEQGLFKS